jgi:hypothetical protein
MRNAEAGDGCVSVGITRLPPRTGRAERGKVRSGHKFRRLYHDHFDLERGEMDIESARAVAKAKGSDRINSFMKLKLYRGVLKCNR